MIPIRELAGVVHPGRREKRYLMLFRFYCDESYDGDANSPKYFTISGFFSSEDTWSEVEEEWVDINRNVPGGFHATELNGLTGRYSGWDRERDAIPYSARLLHCINRQKDRMRAYNCGIRGDAYREIINNEGQVKMGHPWMVCFKSIIAMIAKDMETLPPEDSVAIIFGHESRFDRMAIATFWEIKENPRFPYGHRLATATPADAKDVPCIQVADIMAYEYFKRLWGMKDQRNMRHPLRMIREHNAYCEGYFGESTLRKLKPDIESARCGPNELVIVPTLMGE